MKTKIYRINWRTYLRFRRMLPPLKEESMTSYFERLSLFIEELNKEIEQNGIS